MDSPEGDTLTLPTFAGDYIRKGYSFNFPATGAKVLPRSAERCCLIVTVNGTNNTQLTFGANSPADGTISLVGGGAPVILTSSQHMGLVGEEVWLSPTGTSTVFIIEVIYRPKR